MASSNKTTHLRLNLWSSNDPVLRTDFNADNSRVDLAVHQRALLRLASGSLSGKQATISIPLEADFSQYRQLQLVCAPVVAEGTYAGSFTGPTVQLSVNNGTKANLMRISEDPAAAQGFEVHLFLTPNGLAGFNLGGSSVTAVSGLGNANLGASATLRLSLTDSAQFGAGCWYAVYGLQK